MTHLDSVEVSHGAVPGGWGMAAREMENYFNVPIKKK